MDIHLIICGLTVIEYKSVGNDKVQLYLVIKNDKKVHIYDKNFDRISDTDPRLEKWVTMGCPSNVKEILEWEPVEIDNYKVTLESKKVNGVSSGVNLSRIDNNIRKILLLK